MPTINPKKARKIMFWNILERDWKEKDYPTFQYLVYLCNFPPLVKRRPAGY
jgi:hypothetical protein